MVCFHFLSKHTIKGMAINEPNSDASGLLKVLYWQEFVNSGTRFLLILALFTFLILGADKRSQNWNANLQDTNLLDIIHFYGSIMHFFGVWCWRAEVKEKSTSYF